MNKFLLLLTLLGLAFGMAQAQTELPDESFPLDDSVATTVEAVELYGGPSDGNAAPQAANLRSRMPPVGSIGKAPAGQSLGWAICYYAATMTLGLKPADALSPYFLFDMLTKANDRCQLPSQKYMHEIQRILMEVGCLRKSDYPASGNCQVRPSPASYQNKLRHRIILNVLLTAPPGGGLSSGQVLHTIQRKLNAGQPVIGIMKADAAFRKLKAGIWQPDSQPGLFTHALLIVGYDDRKQEVEVVNCWGTGWGNGGYGRIAYQDLYHFKQLYQVFKPTEPAVIQDKLKPPSANLPAHTPAVKPPSPGPSSASVVMHGNLRMRIPVAADASGNPLFEELDFKKSEGVYEMAQPRQWPLKQQFQLVVDRLTPGTYLYLLGVDGVGTAQIYWPQKTAFGHQTNAAYSALVSDQRTAFVLPRPRLADTVGGAVWIDRVFTKDVSGAEFFVALHSTKPLDDAELLGIKSELNGRHNSAQLLKKVQAKLGDQLLAGADVRYDTRPIRYETKSGRGQVLPVVLRLD
ncbi:C1 family peptidase [Persicitalea jodogahamensis]|uniref:Peptidase C1A papain C-terminal domain-containing protein n=1 Tax=Persicitalea jodogahamensis TaxID=402147 RepID=A0A8J3D8S0_9BACT|nr:C1 family peptidase [Persicitalea jodogahamensis]GHB88872.1 hypothetical protein GCM10007390_51220 [Persicitalea jodogahamensis]